MQAFRLITFPGIGIPCQKSPHCRLVVPCPKIDFLRLLIIVLPTVTERIIVFPIRVHFIAKRIILVDFRDFATFIRQAHHISMRVCHIILLLCILSLIRIHKIVSTDIPFLHLSALGKFHNQLIPIPDKEGLLPIDCLTRPHPSAS